MPTPRSKAGRLHFEDGSVEPARFYYSNHEEEPPPLTQVDSRYTTWIEDDGTVGIRRGTSISVGASAAYAANYDTLDWGN
jgi:hypothetical protein